MTEEQGLVSADAHSVEHEHHMQAADLHRLAAHHFAAAARYQLVAAEAAADALGLLLQTARAQGATLVIATHDARVAALIPPGNNGQIGFQPLQILRKQLSNEEQIAPAAAQTKGAAP